MNKFIAYLNNHPIVKKCLDTAWKICCVILIVGSVVLVFQLSDWIASWSLQNIFGIRYNSLGKERTTIYGFVKYYLPALFFIVLSMILNKPRNSLEIMGLVIHFKWRHLIAIVLTVPVFLGLAYMFKYVMRDVFRDFEYLTWHVGWGWHAMSQSNSDWYHIVFSVICAPVGEEVIFRGWLYGMLRHIIPSRWFVSVAVIITSICFAWIHFNFNRALLAFCFSVCLCVLREYTGNIYGGMIIHSLWNLQSFFSV